MAPYSVKSVGDGFALFPEAFQGPCRRPVAQPESDQRGQLRPLAVCPKTRARASMWSVENGGYGSKARSCGPEDTLPMKFEIRQVFKFQALNAQIIGHSQRFPRGLRKCHREGNSPSRQEGDPPAIK